MSNFSLVILAFLTILLFVSPVEAQTPAPTASTIGTSGYGQILGITLDGPDSDPGCKGAGEPGMDVIPREGAGTKTFYFSPNSNTHGRCVVIISFRGDPGFASGPVGGGVATVNANQSYTYNFSTLANSGRMTQNAFYYRFYVDNANAPTVSSPPIASASPIASSPPPSGPPPGPFGHLTYSTACPYPNQPSATISWTTSQNATSYRIYWLDSADGTQQPPGGIPVGNVTSYNLNTLHGLIPGHYYGFVIAAENPYGAAVTNQPPYSSVAPGGWSHYIYGWVLMPTCGGPGAFDLNRAPTPGCPAFNQSQIQIHWNLSQDATFYKIYPQSTLRGWPVLWPNGYDPSGIFPTEAFFAHNIPPPIPANEGWEYSVYALNPYGIRMANNNNSSYYIYGWTMAWNCDIPVVDLKIDGSDIIKTISDGETVTVNYWVNNAYTLTTSSSRLVTLTSPWRNLYPSNNPVVNPWSTNGTVSLTLYNNATYPYNSYQFTITGINDKIGSYAASRTVTVNVLPEKEPYIQTSQGDVHSNQNIDVPE